MFDDCDCPLDDGEDQCDEAFSELRGDDDRDGYALLNRIDQLCPVYDEDYDDEQ